MVVNVNTMAGGPALGWENGETPRQWQQRILAERQSREKQPTPTAMSAPKAEAPKPTELYRREAERIVAELGAERGREYVAAGMTYGEALAAEHKKLSAEREQLTAEADSRGRKAKSFVGRFNAFGSKHKQRADAAE